jgi:hydroxyacylglutathione hydrolase
LKTIVYIQDYQLKSLIEDLVSGSPTKLIVPRKTGVTLTEIVSADDLASAKFSAELPQMQILPLGDFQTNCYILSLPSGECLVIDPGLDPEPLLELLENSNLKPMAVLLTHAHLDHISGCNALKAKYEMPIYLNPEDRFLYDGVVDFGRVYGLNLEPAPRITKELRHGQQIKFGTAAVEVIGTPGHSPGSVCLRFVRDSACDLLICGDTLFQGSYGRTDLPGGSTSTLYHSITSRIFNLPEDTQIFPGHGPATTVGGEMRSNPILEFGR